MNGNLEISKTLQGESISLSKAKGTNSLFFLIFLLAVNASLGIILYKNRQLATLHALILPAIAVVTLFFKKPYSSLIFLSYIVNSHVLWRMTKAKVFWEYGKYVSLVLIVLILFRYVKKVKNFVYPGLFILFLSVSVPLTINYYSSIPLIRRALSFNLSGPVLFAFSTLLFYNIKISKSQMKRVLLTLSMPTLSMASISLYSVLTKRIIYTETSNFAASGGFGPNQVSASMGLGALILLILAVNYYNKISEKILLYTLSLWLFVQSILTFSRGGVFNFTVALLGFLWFSIRDSNTRLRVLSAVSVLSLLLFTLLPKIQYLTQGKLQERFTNLNPTGRDKVALAEIKLFEKHPLFGVGPGVGTPERTEILGYNIASHTEYTRLLGEHGLFGLMALILLALMLYIPLKNVTTPAKKGENAAFVLWTIAEMAHSATRIAITGFLPGIAYLNIHRSDEEQ